MAKFSGRNSGQKSKGGGSSSGESKRGDSRVEGAQERRRGQDDRRGSKTSSGSKAGSTGGRKVVKNARSLADVLSGNRGRSQSETGRGPEDSPVRRSEPTDRAGVSKKLTYIMSFQPPEERGRSNQPSTAQVPQNAPTEIAPEKNAKKAEAPAQRSRFDENPPPKKNSPSRDTFLAKRGVEPHRDENRNRTLRTERGSKNSVSSKPSTTAGRTAQRVERAPTEPGAWPQNRVKATPVVGKAESGDVQKGRSGRAGARQVTGIIKRHPDGFGFLIVDQPDTPDVYVARQSMTGIMTNDKVEVELYRPRSAGKSKDDRLSGEIVKILSRANTRVVGRYLAVDKKYGILQDENRGWGADLRIAAGDTLEAKDGELVAVEIMQYPDDEHEFTGKVVSIIGDSDDPINDVLRVVYQANIPTEFSKQAIADAQKFGGAVSDPERRGREDLTTLPLITIDGATAKDFDDAICAEQTAQGFRLTVAIADVSHYVKPGTRLDDEAYERGTSTYFPNYVVPMLPEELSNELCSLKPDVPRLCFCCEMNINFEGEIQSFRFFEGVMQSRARVTYGEAQEVIDAHDSGDELTNKTAKKLAHVTENILKSRDLAKILMAKRFRDGSLDLEIPETQVVVDSSGESTDIIRASRIFAHRLIEELMLVTNICTARFLDEAKIPGIYRIHEAPDPENVQKLQRYLWNMGGSRSVTGGNLAKKLTSALEAVAGKPESQVLNILTLRTMQQARYASENVGHFGLGFSHYSHFTSPIRRYPDLIAHRLIKSQIYDRYHGMTMSEDEIASATTWLSATEQRSTKAERKVISIKKARFIKRFVGEEFDGMVSSVAKFGIFVLLRQYDVDGLVKVENLGKDRFEFDEENLRLIGRRSGLQYSIGDEVKVRVVNADTDTGKIDFELAEFAGHSDEDSDSESDAHADEEKRGARKERSNKGPRKKDRKDVAKAGSKPTQGRGAQSEKRGKSADDRRSVRKERVSKRRGKD